MNFRTSATTFRTSAGGPADPRETQREREREPRKTVTAHQEPLILFVDEPLMMVAHTNDESYGVQELAPIIDDDDDDDDS